MLPLKFFGFFLFFVPRADDGVVESERSLPTVTNVGVQRSENERGVFFSPNNPEASNERSRISS